MITNIKIISLWSGVLPANFMTPKALTSNKKIITKLRW